MRHPSKICMLNPQVKSRFNSNFGPLNQRLEVCLIWHLRYCEPVILPQNSGGQHPLLGAHTTSYHAPQPFASPAASLFWDKCIFFEGRRPNQQTVIRVKFIMGRSRIWMSTHFDLNSSSLAFWIAMARVLPSEIWREDYPQAFALLTGVQINNPRRRDILTLLMVRDNSGLFPFLSWSPCISDTVFSIHRQYNLENAGEEVAGSLRTELGSLMSSRNQSYPTTGPCRTTLVTSSWVGHLVMDPQFNTEVK